MNEGPMGAEQDGGPPSEVERTGTGLDRSRPATGSQQAVSGASVAGRSAGSRAATSTGRFDRALATRPDAGSSGTGRFNTVASGTGRFNTVASGTGRFNAVSSTGRLDTQTLAASWTPEAGLLEDIRKRPQARRRLASYGWRMYALPILLVLTALVVMQPGWLAGTDRAAPVASTALPSSGRPTLAEAPGGALFSGDIPSAELPGVGGEIPAAGSGTYRVLKGASDRVGTGRLYTFTVEVEEGVSLAEGDDSFGRLVQETLLSPQSWVGSPDPKISLQRVDTGTPDFRVSLISQDTARRLCDYGKPIPYDTSCYRGDDRILINAARWVRGAIAFNGDIGTYRRYAINHEVGHFFNKGHVPCSANGELAPVMMQQTFSVSNDDLSQITGNTQGGPIPRNGMVCKPNAWPYPRGAPQAG